ncbi:MAG: UpxY family transcription antiterminator [Acidobacteria bacterium]|nr:UpxY family transcription antiterminator [Acidobacteriota bacterium]
MLPHLQSDAELTCTSPVLSEPLLPAPRWFALYTMPQSENSIRRLLDIRNIESFLPTYEVQKVWKNRQKVKTQRPLFPSYLFVRIGNHQRSIVLSAPGALRIIGNSHTPLPIPDREIEFLQSQFINRKIEPYLDMVIGKRVRIRSGPMEGLEGTLVEKRNSFRFVLTVAMINQHAAIEVSPDDLELIRR